MPIVINGSTGISGTDGSAGTPAVQGTDTNTGIYFPGPDRIGFAEGGVQVGEFDASGNFLFNSGYGSVATAYGCRAWVNFNGIGTVAIRASGNVSSITDNGTGDYTVNFTTALTDANYAVAGITDGAALLSENNNNVLRSTTQLRLTAYGSVAGNLTDRNHINVAVFR